MQKLLLFLLIQLLFTHCSSVLKNEEQLSTEKIKEYERIISGIQREYVLYYRLPGVKQFLSISEVAFKKDSLIYKQCYQDFFEQNYSLVEWLLTFENDTIRKDVWHKSLNPLSSNIEECNQPISNSRAAIILIENYLNGKDFICYSCHFQDHNNCNKSRYRYIKNWLAQHKELSIENMRKNWKEQNIP